MGAGGVGGAVGRRALPPASASAGGRQQQLRGMGGSSRSLTGGRSETAGPDCELIVYQTEQPYPYTLAASIHVEQRVRSQLYGPLRWAPSAPRPRCTTPAANSSGTCGSERACLIISRQSRSICPTTTP